MAITAFSKEKLLNHQFKSMDDFIFFKEKGLVPICIKEIKKIVPHYTITFIKAEDKYSACILTDLLPDNNLYISKDGKWLGDYIPAMYRTMPFIFSPAKESKQKVLCYFDELNCILPQDKCNEKFSPIFDNKQEFTKDFKDKLTLIKAFNENIETTHDLCEKLNKLDLITEWPLTLKLADGEKDVKGLHRIDEVKLLEIISKKPQSILNEDLLLMAYAQIFSSDNLEKLSSFYIDNNNLDDNKKIRENTKSLRTQVLEKQQKETKEELDELVKNLISDE